MTPTRFPRLYPAQVCFVVDDVDAAVEECIATFGWGPFHRFTAPVSEARYRDWTGPKKTDVALGMAGAVQVELIHVHAGGTRVAQDLPVGASLEGEWLEDGETFGLYDWSGGAGTLQVRR